MELIPQEKLKQILSDRSLLAVSKLSGVKYFHLQRVHKGEGDKVPMGAIKKLIEYINKGL